MKLHRETRHRFTTEVRTTEVPIAHVELVGGVRPAGVEVRHLGHDVALLAALSPRVPVAFRRRLQKFNSVGCEYAQAQSTQDAGRDAQRDASKWDLLM